MPDFSANGAIICEPALDWLSGAASGLHIARAKAQLPPGRKIVSALYGPEFSRLSPEKDFFNSISAQRTSQPPRNLALAANARCEPFLLDAALRSNGNNVGQSGRSVIARYAYS